MWKQIKDHFYIFTESCYGYFFYYYFKFWSGVWELSKVNIQGLPNGIGYFIIST